MYRFSWVQILIVALIISIAHSYPQSQSQQVQNVGTFLQQLLRDYVPKNARPYTIINGNPSFGSETGRVGAAPTKQQMIPPRPNGQFMMFSPPPVFQFPNTPPQMQERWSPVPPTLLSQQYAILNDLARSDHAFGAQQFPTGQGQRSNLEDENTQKIITAENVPANSAKDQSHDIAEIQIQSQMAF